MATKYFEPRTSSPSDDNKFYIKAGKGGYNKAMEINSTTHSCLPNCCGEVHGRWLESQGQTDYDEYDNLCLGNASSYWGKDDGYERGQTPKLGAVMCYSKDGGAGHVAFVEEIYDNGDVLSSNSGYNGSRFFTKKLTKSSNYNFGSKYHFQGFIYPPVDFTNDIIIQPVPRDENKDQLKVLVTNLQVRFAPSLNSEVRGVVQRDKIYNFKGTAINDGYTWYQIDDIQWIPSNGKWLDVYPRKDSGDIEQLKKELDEANELIKELKIRVQEQDKEILNLNAMINDLQQEIDKFRNVYTCEETGTYKFRIKLYKGEGLYIK